MDEENVSTDRYRAHPSEWFYSFCGPTRDRSIGWNPNASAGEAFGRRDLEIVRRRFNQRHRHVLRLQQRRFVGHFDVGPVKRLDGARN